MGSWDFHKVCTAFSEAAIDPALWDRAMEVVAAETGSFGTALFPIRGRSPRIPFTGSLGEAFERYLSEGWVHHDERYRAVPWIERRGVATDFDFISEEEMKRHAYYQEFLAPFKLKWFAAVGVAAEGDLFSLAIQRRSNEGRFSVDEQRKLSELSPRLCTAAAIARALDFSRAESVLDAFNVSRTAAVLLDINAEVIKANSAAERLFDDEVRIANKRITSVDRGATATLDRALHGLLWTRSATALVPPVALPRIAKRPVLAHPMRIERVSASVLAPCQAIVVLTDMERLQRPAQDMLRNLFGLTPAEARLAVQLANGEALADAADHLGVSKETARSHLKAVFEKTGTHRQAELVALLARLPLG